MAQTKRKRRTKHRGNAAGMVETRGRTGRRPAGDQRKNTRTRAREARMSRRPSWRSAANRALLSTVVFVAAVTLLLDQPVGSAIALAGFMLLIYIPLGYYTDLFFYRRRQAKRLREGGP